MVAVTRLARLWLEDARIIILIPDTSR